MSTCTYFVYKIFPFKQRIMNAVGILNLSSLCINYQIDRYQSRTGAEYNSRVTPIDLSTNTSYYGLNSLILGQISQHEIPCFFVCTNMWHLKTHLINIGVKMGCYDSRCEVRIETGEQRRDGCNIRQDAALENCQIIELEKTRQY